MTAINFKSAVLPVFVLLFSGCGLQRSINRQVDRDPVLSKAFTGIYLFEEKKQKAVAKRNETKLFVPASNTKLLTAYASLRHLPDSLPGWFMAETVDTLYLRPNGDPTFLHRSFAYQKVLELIKGTAKPVVLVAPSKAFGNWGNGWPWNDYDAAYMPERSVMPVYGNVVRFRRGNGKWDIVPSYFEALTDTAPAGLTAPVSLYRNETENRFRLLHTSGNGSAVPFTQRTDADIVYKLLADTLARAGTRSFSVVRSAPGVPFTPLYTQATDSVLAFMMHNSDNLFAEQFLLMVGTQLKSVLADRITIDSLVRSDLAPFQNNSRWADGSGLSRYNTISPLAFVTLLKKMRTDFSWDRIAAILPAGGEGTLTGYYTQYGNQLFAKTGTLNGQIALSGYLITNKKRRYIFSFLVNNHQDTGPAVRRAVERIVTRLIETK